MVHPLKCVCKFSVTATLLLCVTTVTKFANRKDERDEGKGLQQTAYGTGEGPVPYLNNFFTLVADLIRQEQMA